MDQLSVVGCPVETLLSNRKRAPRKNTKRPLIETSTGDLAARVGRRCPVMATPGLFAWTLEHGADLGRQGGVSERLNHQLDTGIERAVMNNSVARVSGRV